MKPLMLIVGLLLMINTYTFSYQSDELDHEYIAATVAVVISCEPAIEIQQPYEELQAEYWHQGPTIGPCVTLHTHKADYG
ncbi:MAG: hypothetical protein ACQ5SW_00020 [Sphaerochaetaceae bacterium]